MKTEKLVAQLIGAELRAAGVRPDLFDLAGLLVEQAVKVDEIDGEAVLAIVDEKGNPRVGDLAGNPLTLRNFVAELRAGRRSFLFEMPKPAEVDPKPQGEPKAETLTESMARQARELREARAVDAKREDDTTANPWAPASYNLTAQMVMTNRDPTRAARLRAAAGVA